MDYEKKFILGDLVKGLRTFNGEIIEGKFNGFHLHDILDPTSVIGVICVENDRCYDVVVGSIELLESEDEKIRKALLEMIHDTTGDSLWVDYNVHKEDALAWLEKQGEQKSAWSADDEVGLGDAMWAIEQARGIAKDESDMGSLWYAERWLKSVKERMKGE